MYEIIYQGKGLSLNAVKSQYWRKTEQQKNAIKEVMSVLILQANIKHLTRFKLEVFYNSRLDTDNIVPLCKVLIDCIRRKGLIPDDTKKYYRGFAITPDETLPKDTYKFRISEVK